MKNKIDFTTKSLIEELQNLEQGFRDRNKMTHYNAIVIAIANVFREQKEMIFKHLGVSTNAKHLGYRATLKPTPKVPVNPNPSATSTRIKKEPCATCGNKTEVQNKPLDPETNVQQHGNITAEMLLKAKSWREILNAFSGRSEDMLKFCITMGIKKGNTKRADTLAKKIYTFIQHEYNA